MTNKLSAEELADCRSRWTSNDPYELGPDVADGIALLAHIAALESNLATSEAARERAEELVLVHRKRYRATCSDCPTDCLDRFEVEAILAHTDEAEEVLQRISAPDPLASPEIERDYFAALARSYLRSEEKPK